MPRGKELEQLPMSHTMPGAGDDKSKFDRNVLTGMPNGETPHPAKANSNQKKP